MDAIEQFSYLLFLKRLDDEEKRREKLAALSGKGPLGYTRRCRRQLLARTAEMDAPCRA